MKFTRNECFRAGKWIGMCLLAMAVAWMAHAQTFTTTTVQGTVYLANGAPGAGTLQLSWPAFTTASNQTVMAGRTTVTIGTDGFVSVNLAPNLGSTPAGLYYTAVFNMSDGTTSTEYWVVPATTQATLSQVRSQLMPSVQAVQAVNKAYVDQAIQSITQSSLTGTGGTLSGPLYLSGDPTQSLQAADKHYVDSAFSQAVPLTGGLAALGGASLSTTSAQTFAGAVNAPAVTASVNTQINVMAPPYNAKGDCVTDDQAAIQAAVNAAGAYNPPAVVYFPKPSGGCYLTSTIQWNGAPLKGQPPPHGLNGGGGGVGIKGKPGQDILHVQDPTTVGSVAPSRVWSIDSLDFMVDNSTSPSFPHRWPGRWVADGAMTSGSATLTSTHANFTCGDIGQPVQVNGAGASGANLVTTISSVSSCSPVSGYATTATLAATASTTVTGASTYISVNNIPVTTTIGNAAIAFDQYDGNSADYHMTGSIGSLGDAIRDVDVVATNTNACAYLDQCPNAAAIYFQGSWAPYGIDARNINIGPGLMFGIVEGVGDTNPTMGYIGQDYQTWDMGGWHSVYPWISYNGTFTKISRIQLADNFGPQVLSIYSASEYQPNAWTIDSNPEFELNCYHLSTAPTTCVPGIGWRITGGQHYINMTKLASNNATAIIDSFASNYTNVSTLGYLQMNGYANHISMNGDAGALSLLGWTDNGIGNSLSGQYLASPFNQKPQTRPAALNATRGRNLVGQISTDFIRSGNVTTPWFNDLDLFFWPSDILWHNPTSIYTDLTSLSDHYAAVTATEGINGFALFNTQSSNIGQAIISNAPAGGQVPASKVIIYVSAKCPSITSYTFEAQATNTLVAQSNFSCTTSYTTQSLVADYSAYAGSFLKFYLVTTGEVDIAWVAVRPFQADYNGYQPAPTNNATFTGTTTTAALSATALNATTVTTTGNISTTGYTQLMYEGDPNTNRIDDPAGTSGNGRIFSSSTETIQGNTSVVIQGSTANALTVNSTGASLTAGKTYQIGGTQIAASNLSNGTLGSGAVVLAANTMGCLDGYDHLPCVVAKSNLTGQTAALGAPGTQFYTVTASGLYRIEEAATVSAVGTSGTLQTNVRTYNGVGTSSTDCSSGSFSFTAVGQTWQTCAIYATSGATMNYWESNAPNGATWNLYITVERLQ